MGMISSPVTHVDVLVVGGGPSGFAAAVSSARTGASTALLERHPMLGGMATVALVNNFCPAHLDGTRLIIGGVFGEFRERLIEKKAIFSAPDNATYMMEMFNPEVYAETMVEFCERAGVSLHLGCRILDVETQPSTGETSLRTSKGRFTAHTIVDATGDACIAASLGLPFTFGRSSDDAVMPLTFCYEIGPIDLETLEREMPYKIPVHPVTQEKHFCISNQGKTNTWIQEAKAKGELTIPRDHIAGIMNYPGQPDHATVNFGRVTIEDPTDPEQLMAAEAEGLRQIENGISFFRNYLPGFDRIELKRKALQIGVRETRQVIGLHTLTGAEAKACTQFEDVIAQCCYAIDIHQPGEVGTILIPFEPGTHFDIPWRSLIPASGPGNLVVTGRCISADQEAMSAFRVSPSVMAIGEAAGITAALASQQNLPVAEVGHQPVQKELLAHGGILA